jgi:hypothetical protein
MEILDRLPAAVAELGAAAVSQIVGTLDATAPAVDSVVPLPPKTTR